jgi:ribosome biogenesis GTPase YqeH
MKHCEGCGARMQSVEPNKPGYVPLEIYLENPTQLYCERCYNLIHYNRKLAVEIPEEEFLKHFREIAESKALVVNVLDIFDLEGTFQEELLRHFPDNPLLVVGNKFDLFLNSVRLLKVEVYLQRFLKEHNINPRGTMVISARKYADLKRLLEEIMSLQNNRDVYLFGTTNVGKSTLINGLLDLLGIARQKLTVSTTIGTTLDLVRIPLPNSTHIIDTPGIPNRKQATYYLDHENLQLMMPKKYLKPRIFQLMPGQTLFIGGFGYLQFLSGEKTSFVINIPQALPVHRTKNEAAAEFFAKHGDDILKVPNEAERARLGDLREYRFNFGPQKQDLALSGVGFVTLVGSGEISLYCYEKIKISIREAII